VKPIAKEIAELRAMNGPELIERYVAMFGKAPRCRQPSWLLQRCAWRLQEMRLGGLSEVAKARLEELIAEIDIDLGAVRAQVKRGRKDALGVTVKRTWKGREISATTVEGGRWEHDGVVYRSLSAIAEHVTGAHWNGKHFFGLTKRKDAP
jgi:hypothetical protein